MLAEIHNDVTRETLEFLQRVVLKRCTIEGSIVKDRQYEELKGVHLIAKLLSDGATLGSTIHLQRESRRTFKATLTLQHLGFRFNFTCYKTEKDGLNFSTQDYVLGMNLHTVVCPSLISNKHIEHSLTTSLSETFTVYAPYVSITEAAIYINFIEAQRARVGMNQQTHVLDTYLSEQLGGKEMFLIENYPRYTQVIEFI